MVFFVIDPTLNILSEDIRASFPLSIPVIHTKYSVPLWTGLSFVCASWSFVDPAAIAVITTKCNIKNKP